MIYSNRHFGQGESTMEQPHLLALETKHAALDQRISEEALRPRPDETLLQNLKKQKLRLKEEMSLH
jgi:hypothetical protein